MQHKSFHSSSIPTPLSSPLLLNLHLRWPSSISSPPHYLAMAAVRPREATPPPVIGKAGRYTVFITPPPTPKTSESVVSPHETSVGPEKASPLPVTTPPSLTPTAELSKTPRVQDSPRIQVPPQQFEKPAARGSGSLFGFFWDAIARVQDVHSSLDEYVAEWFGLNQSKYQWAINDYYENHGKETDGVKADAKQKQLRNKVQTV